MLIAGLLVPGSKERLTTVPSGNALARKPPALSTIEEIVSF
jgi:hypothetical protein